ncbi:hypothetical protein [Microvirga terrestris]|uniref:hypothetical protein n=1 Tax=Microvirga terrestris TaxID=2791024 RepID=UPI001FEE76DD|nr:hypothetical protein [Microvirga terrestris]
MLGDLDDTDRLAELVAGADPDAQLQLAIESSTGLEARLDASGSFVCPRGRRTGTPEGRADDARP